MKRLQEIQKLFEKKGYGIIILEDKIRIEKKPYHEKKDQNFATSAGFQILHLSNKVLGHFRYKENCNKPPYKLQKKTYILTDRNDKRIRVYDMSHGQDFHYQDYDANGKIKAKRISFKGSIADIINECIHLLLRRQKR